MTNVNPAVDHIRSPEDYLDRTLFSIPEAAGVFFRLTARIAEWHSAPRNAIPRSY